MLSVFLPEAPFEHRSVSFRTSLMGCPGMPRPESEAAHCQLC
jgi:hypothetical protein